MSNAANKSATKSLNLRISEAQRQMRDARTTAEVKCLEETVSDCRRQLAALPR